MRALTLTGPRRLELRETPEPVPDGQQVIIRVNACGICGSDLHYWDAGLDMTGKPGLVLGHEFCGNVADAGCRSDLSCGERVTALPLDPCGECGQCQAGRPNLCTHGMKRSIPGNSSPGAYADFVRVRPDMVRKLPAAISDEEAAMIEPAAVALHAVRQAGTGTGDRVLITGGGAIGRLCALWARIGGASCIALTEVNAERRASALDSGDADAVFDAADPKVASALKKYNPGGFDAAIETSASDSGISTAITALKPGGTLLLAGISFHPQTILTLPLVFKEILQKGALGYLPEEFDLARQYLSDKRLDLKHLVSRVVDLSGVQETFERLSSGTSSDIKVVIRISR